MKFFCLFSRVILKIMINLHRFYVICYFFEIMRVTSKGLHVAIETTVIVLNIQRKIAGELSSENMASFISGLKKSKKHQLIKDVTAKVTFAYIKKLSYGLENRASTSCFRLIIMHLTSNDCNPGDPESRDWRRPNPGITGLQN